MNLDENSVDPANLVDQNDQFYFQTSTGDGQLVLVGGMLKFKFKKF